MGGWQSVQFMLQFWADWTSGSVKGPEDAEQSGPPEPGLSRPLEQFGAPQGHNQQCSGAQGYVLACLADHVVPEIEPRLDTG